jgi:glycerophosphoryl diester phosphodiesterase
VGAMPERFYKKVGHKGADAIERGNTLASFYAAAEAGVDMIELDVLRDREGRLIVAHDHEDARRRRPLDLTDALDAFLEPPLDELEVDFDLKLPGREPELAGAIEGHGLLDRAMVSTMEIDSIIRLRRIEPELRIGWTVPKTRRDWTKSRLAAPAVAGALAGLRRRLPRLVAKRAPRLGVQAVWAYHRLVSPRLVAAAERAEIELYAWTVDDADRIAALAAMGVTGICSNDPRLFVASATATRQAASQDGGKPEGASQRAKERVEVAAGEDEDPAGGREPAAEKS